MTVENPSAFPLPGRDTLTRIPPQSGMTLRDWFAGHFAAHAFGVALADKGPMPETYRIARSAYALADAMLAERSKAGGQS